MSAPNTVPVTPGTPLPEPAGLRPARIGPYRILRVLGQGGMGLVYEAEQLEPLRRMVALKRGNTTISALCTREYWNDEEDACHASPPCERTVRAGGAGRS